MLSVSIRSFSYAEKEIISNLSFSLDTGAHLCVLGESGCGKSTLLHLIYGLLDLPLGTISWNGTQLLGPKHNLIPGESFIKLVAQEFNVMPYISVAENIATYLSRNDGEQDTRRVNELLDVVDLTHFKDTMVKSLSGGQKQRVALAKALAKKPELLLLDEPFSNIDTFRKNKLRRQLFAYLKKEQISCVTATHDAEEALAFSDSILLLNNGKKDLFGAPKEIYDKLKTPYQASFFGEVTWLPKGVFTSEKDLFLPHELIVSEEETLLKVVVVRSYFKGSHYLVEARFGVISVFFEHSDAIEKETVYLKEK